MILSDARTVSRELILLLNKPHNTDGLIFENMLFNRFHFRPIYALNLRDVWRPFLAKFGRLSGTEAEVLK
jgi:hypothetical protein